MTFVSYRHTYYMRMEDSEQKKSGPHVAIKLRQNINGKQ
jgi:hypothetical protein